MIFRRNNGDVAFAYEDTIEYLITDGQATITKQGKLKVDEDAIVTSTITVMAQSGDTKSNKITYHKRPPYINNYY